MFLGQYEHTIDEKGRMTIPARFRELLGDGGYITFGFDHNLIVLTTESFNVKAQKANEPGITNSDARFFRRFFFAKAHRLEFDKAGRILIPQFLREQAGLSNAAIVAGVGTDFEIWSPERWAEQTDLMQDAEAIAERFEKLDI